MSLSLETAVAIIDVALAKGREINCAPLSVAVVDSGGHLIAFKRQDRSGILRFDIAYGKAWGALGMGFGTRELAKRAEGNPAFINSIAAASHGRIIPSPGGVLILEDGNVIGAVGISGDAGERDEECALAGIADAGLSSQPGIA